MGFCSFTVKLVLFVFNILCAIVGLTVLAIAVWIFSLSNNLRDVLHGEVSGTLITMMVLGGVTLIIACFGCCGAIKENPCYIITYATLLSIILLAQLVVAGIALHYFKARNFEQQLVKNLENSFGNYEKHHLVIDSIHQSFRCCGFDGPLSWQGDLPASCCALKPSIVGQSCPRPQAFTKDCKGPVVAEMKYALKVVVITLFTIVGVEFLCIASAVFVACTLRKKKRAGYSY